MRKGFGLALWSRRILIGLILLLSLALIAPVYSSPTLSIDGSGSNTCPPQPMSCSVTGFSTSNPNDVVIVFAASASVSFNGLPTASGLSFTLRQSTPLGVGGGFVAEWWAIASTPLSGATVTVNVHTTTLEEAIGLVVWSISGANTVSPFDPSLASPAINSGTTPGCPLFCSVSISVTIPSTSNANDMILGMAGNIGGTDTFSAGTGGFTLIAGPSFAGAEFKVVSSTQSSLSVPITLNNDGGDVPWTMFGDAVQAATVTPPIPEYPLGLPILAIFTVLAYGVIRHRTRN